MNHDEIRELLGAYALDAVEPDEYAVITQHLEFCLDCRSDLEKFQTAAAALATANRPELSESWDTIAAQLEPTNRFRSINHRTMNRWLGAVAAGLIVLVGLQFSTTTDLRNAVTNAEADLAASETAREGALVALDSAERELANVDGLSLAARQASQSPDARQVSLEQDSTFVTIVLSADGTGYVSDHNLPKLSPDQTYQLWAIVGDEIISAAVLGPDPATVPFRIDADGLVGFAVTQEATGGVVTSGNDALVVWLDS